MTNGMYKLAVFAFLQRDLFAIGLLSEYIKSEEEYDEMELVIDVARGVAYLHCESFIVLLMPCGYLYPLRQRKTLFTRTYEGYVHLGLTMLTTKTKIHFSLVFW
jgi:hypothetical protein